jgi:hypothetical protein
MLNASPKTVVRTSSRRSGGPWVTQPNDNLLFRGQSSVDYTVRSGIPGLQQVRGLLDAERGGH